MFSRNRVEDVLRDVLIHHAAKRPSAQKALSEHLVWQQPAVDEVFCDAARIEMRDQIVIG